MPEPARLPSRATGAAVTAVGVLELVVVGYGIAAGSVVLFLAAQTVAALVVAAVALVLAHRRIRRRLHAQTIQVAAEQERARIAEDLHDLLGHHLSVIALRAGNLQLRTDGEARRLASALRAEADEAVDAVHEIIDLLHPDRAGTAPDDLARVIDRATTAGADVVLSGTALADLPASVRTVLTPVLREALTNATRYAPGEVITVATTEPQPDRIRVVVTNRLPPAPPAGSGAPAVNGAPAGSGARTPYGLVAAQRRVAAVGGSLTHQIADGAFVLTVEVPRAPLAARPDPAHRLPPSALVVLISRMVVPATCALLLVLGFYSWSVRDATLEPSAFTAITPGTTETSLRLPTRESPIRLTPVPDHPPGWRCAYYTDANFPLGIAVFEICFDRGTVVRTTDLRELQWT